MLNSYQLNSTQINGTSSGTTIESVTTTEVVSTSDVTLGTPIAPVTSIVTLLDLSEASEYKLSNILEYIDCNSNASTYSLFKNTCLDSVSVIEFNNLLFVAVSTDTINLVNSTSYLYTILSNVIDSIRLEATEYNTSSLKEGLTSQITLLDSLVKFFKENINDVLQTNFTVGNIVSNLEALISSLVLSDGILQSASIVICQKSTASILSNLNSSSIFSYLINEEMLLKVPLDGTSRYVTFLLSPETNSVSNYNNYNFISSTKFGNKYLFSNSSGLYEHGGSTDDGDSIRAEIETVAFNFNSSNLKQVPSIYLGVSSDSTVILKVKVDGKGEAIYKLNRRTNNLQTQKMDIGKGLIGRYFQFELITSAPTFNLESIDFYPIEIKRKI